MVRFPVDHARADESFMRGRQDVVMEGLFEGEGLGFIRREPAHAVVDRQAQPVALGGIGQLQIADCLRQIVSLALLEAQGINLKIAGQLNQLTTGLVLAEVVTDDSNQESTSSEDSWGKT